MNSQQVYNIIYTTVISVFLFSCNEQIKKEKYTVEVKNQLDFKRKEIVAIPYSKIKNVLDGEPFNNVHIKKNGATTYLRTQWIDYDQDGIPEELLFIAEVSSNNSALYDLVLDSTVVEPNNDVIAYSRIVPERADDYTWENDKVAFRAYGPTGQREALAGVVGSTLRSGIDLWLKRTDKSIIDKWYAEHGKKAGYYHIDHGEGYDPYHVGASRGTGGSGVWANDSLYVSENYIEYKTIAAGPLRTVFDLTYSDWSPYNVHELKRVTLDLGSNFSKFDVAISATDSLPNYALGITLHENKGNTAMNQKAGWFRHWEQIDGSYLGEGLVLNPSEIDSAFIHKSDLTDQSNLIVLTRPKDKLIYYAGFAWDKSGQVSEVLDWEKILQQQSNILQSPLKVSLK